MRVPVSWLREFVEVPADATPEDVHAALVSVGFEEEDVHRFGVTGPVVVGEVLDFVEEPQSNGKTIRWCSVRVAPAGAPAADGGPDVRGIVCGARNFAAGDPVVVTLPGSVLPGPFPIAARKTYGHVSDGMMASARELGLGEDHDGILILSALGIAAEPGDDAVALLGLDDWAVEVNVTPDRGYALSVRGIAREYAHATGAAFRDPAGEVEVVDGSGFEVRVDDDAPIRGTVGCDVFVTRVVRGIDPARPTPAGMVARLTLAGMRSVSLPVDITNYVMLELGQPIHAYDLAKLDGGITVRRARAGERLVTLDDQDRALDPEDLVIADRSGPVGIAGVMGGASTEISDGTTDVLVEAAHFDRVSVARASRRHKLSSEASRRFERGVDPAVARAAAARVVQLLVQLAGGTADALGSVLDEAPAPASISMPVGYPAALVGRTFSDDEVIGSLEMLGATLERDGDVLTVTPPTWRPDLVTKQDLTEEVARIVGYDTIPETLPVPPAGRGFTRSQSLRRRIADALAATGLTEVLVFPWVPRGANQRFSPAGEPVAEISLANAIDSETAAMRQSLLPGLVDVAHRNVSRGITDVAVYELGAVVLPRLVDGAPIELGTVDLPDGGAYPGDTVIERLNASLPLQPQHLAGVLVGAATPKQPAHPATPYTWESAIQAARDAAHAAGAQLDLRQGSHAAFHPGRCAELVLDGETIGWAGELLPAIAQHAHLPRVVAAFELDVDRLIELAPATPQARVIAPYPAATQDLSLVVADSVPAGDVLAAVREGAGELLEHIELVDDYRGAGLPPGTKSITVALRFRADDRTLTADEATAAKLAGAALAAERYGATIRA